MTIWLHRGFHSPFPLLLFWSLKSHVKVVLLSALAWLKLGHTGVYLLLLLQVRELGQAGELRQRGRGGGRRQRRVRRGRGRGLPPGTGTRAGGRLCLLETPDPLQRMVTDHSGGQAHAVKLGDGVTRRVDRDTVTVPRWTVGGQKLSLPLRRP